MELAEIKKGYKNFVIVLDEQGIRRLYDEIGTHLKSGVTGEPEITFSIQYSDGSSIQTKDLEEVVKDDNVSGREIKAIEISGNILNREILLVFGPENVTLEISGPNRQWVSVATSVIEDRLKSIKENKRRKGVYIGITALIILTLTYFSSTLLQKYLPPLFVQKGDTREIGLGFMILMFFDIVVFGILSFIVSRLFPNLTFLIGKEVERHNSRRKLRSNIFWSLIVGIALLLLGPIVNRFFL